MSKNHTAHSLSLFLLTLSIAALFILSPGAAAASETFCQTCENAGNCCNSKKVLCVSCGDEEATAQPSSEQLEAEIFASPSSLDTETFCQTCENAGNCCNSKKVLCVSCGDEEATAVKPPFEDQ